MRQTLPKSIILRGYQSFTHVIKSGVSIHGTTLTAFFLTDAVEKRVVVGFSVPKRQVPLAANRIRIKRLMREAVRKSFHELVPLLHKQGVGAKIVLIFKKRKESDAKLLKLSEIEKDWLDIKHQIQKTI